MKKLSVLFAILTLSLVSCRGKVPSEKVRSEAKKMNYLIEMTVSISSIDDSILFIRTNTFELDEKSMSITIREGLISKFNEYNLRALNSSAIKVENAKFSLPYGGRITITNKGGEKFQIVEKY